VKILTITLAAIILASCSAPQPLRTREEATAEAVSEAVVASSGASVAAGQHEETMAAAVASETQVEGKITFWKDPRYGCEYIVTPEGSITPRIYRPGRGLALNHLGCEVE
jgi:hypothetical protein